MFCPNCGTPQADAAVRCGSCGAFLNSTGAHVASGQGLAPQRPVGPPPGYLPPVENHLVFAILTTLFCCLPAGIVAIVYASQVSTKLQMGDYDGAMQASKNARLWSMISLFVMLIPCVLYFFGACGYAMMAGGY